MLLLKLHIYIINIYVYTLRKAVYTYWQLTYYLIDIRIDSYINQSWIRY